MSDPILPLEVWEEGTLQNDVPANDNALRNEAMSRNVIGIANSPGAPSDGDVYIVGAAPTGAFASFDPDDLTIYRGGTWYAWAPVVGVFVNVAGTLGQYTGSGWVSFSAGMTNPMTTAGDVIYGGVSGTPTRLAIGATNYVLTVVAGVPAWAPAAGSVAWGGITGTLSSQTDLQTALDGKAPLAVTQNSQSSAYTLVLSDAGKHIYHPSADTTARIWTIPANSSVAFPIGTVVTFVNDNAAGVITIAITTDTLRLAGAGTTGSRTLAANGIATAIKITSTSWQINGTGLT